MYGELPLQNIRGVLQVECALREELLGLLAKQVLHAVLLAMPVAALRSLCLVRVLVPAVAFGVPALAAVGALVLDAIMWSLVVGCGTP